MISADKARMNSNISRYGVGSLAVIKKWLSRLSLRKYRLLSKETKRCGACIEQASKEGNTQLLYLVALGDTDRWSYVPRYDVPEYDEHYDGNHEYNELCGDLILSLKMRGYKAEDVSYQYNTKYFMILLIEW